MPPLSQLFVHFIQYLIPKLSHLFLQWCLSNWILEQQYEDGGIHCPNCKGTGRFANKGNLVSSVFTFRAQNWTHSIGYWFGRCDSVKRFCFRGEWRHFFIWRQLLECTEWASGVSGDRVSGEEVWSGQCVCGLKVWRRDEVNGVDDVVEETL